MISRSQAIWQGLLGRRCSEDEVCTPLSAGIRSVKGAPTPVSSKAKDAKNVKARRRSRHQAIRADGLARCCGPLVTRIKVG
jgi:hypothetical protein